MSKRRAFWSVNNPKNVSLVMWVMQNKTEYVSKVKAAPVSSDFFCLVIKRYSEIDFHDRHCNCSKVVWYDRY